MKITFIPNILDKKNRKIHFSEWTDKKTIREYLKEAKFKSAGNRIIISGRRAKNLREIPKQTDEIIVTPKVKGPFALGTMIFTALSLASIVPVGLAYTTVMVLGYLAVAGIGIGITMLTNALFAPRRPSFGGGGMGSQGLDANSATYGWDGVQTQQNVGTPIPIIYGRHKVGGNIINQYVSNDGDKSYLHVLLALGEGELEEIASVQINDNDISNFDQVKTAYRLGTNDQTILPDFENLHEIYAVNVNFDEAGDSHIYTTSGADIEGFEVFIAFQAGLYSVAKSTGAIESNSCQLKVEYKEHSAGSYTLLDTFTVSALNRSVVRRSFKKTGLTAGKYDIKVTRISAVSDSFHTSGFQWTQIDELIPEDLSYPNTALLALDFLATDQLSGSTPNITAIVKGRKISIPAILTEEDGDPVPYDDYYYDPTSETFKLFSDDSTLFWDGETFVTAYSANPIWCIKDLLVNKRYGIGEYVDASHIDEPLFLEMAKYCEEKISNGNGGYEKRFRFDMVIDSLTRALDAIYQLSSTFRAMFFFSDNFVKCVIDRPGSAEQLFSMGNISSDSFVQQWKSSKEDFNMIEVQFLDADKNYDQEVISYIDEEAIANGDPLRKKTVRLFCTRVSQAIREARFLLNSCKYLNRSISFKASIDAIAVQVGDIINVSHDLPQWGFGGRIKAYDAETGDITLDQAVSIETGKTYYLQIRHADDSIETKTISTSPGSTAIVRVSEAFSMDPAYFDVFSFGVITSISKPFRVMSIIRSSSTEVDVVAVEYNASIYDDSGPALPTSN